MVTTSSFANAIGRKRIAVALGVLPTAVSNHVVRGKFPGSWYLVLKALADEEGVECPDDIFDMKMPAATDRKPPSGAAA